MNPNSVIEVLRFNASRNEDRVAECIEPDGTVLTFGYVPIDDGEDGIYVKHVEGMQRAHESTVDALEAAVNRCDPEVHIRRHGDSIFGELSDDG